eukprot:TRINITY_DN46741_c0_g1_i2.p1 TRINITY_DN46741_c0_g1~~TRINITY_DN46741_c0_g1_i2.p1  ORF type:complete len:685 (+),score=185.88 TRINITY_DN46741_c0_g1_i2:141-2195(+)
MILFQVVGQLVEQTLSVVCPCCEEDGADAARMRYYETVDQIPASQAQKAAQGKISYASHDEKAPSMQLRPQQQDEPASPAEQVPSEPQHTAAPAPTAVAHPGQSEQAQAQMPANKPPHQPQEDRPPEDPWAPAAPAAAPAAETFQEPRQVHRGLKPPGAAAPAGASAVPPLQMQDVAKEGSSSAPSTAATASDDVQPSRPPPAEATPVVTPTKPPTLQEGGSTSSRARATDDRASAARRALSPGLREGGAPQGRATSPIMASGDDGRGGRAPLNSPRLAGGSPVAAAHMPPSCGTPEGMSRARSAGPAGRAAGGPPPKAGGALAAPGSQSARPLASPAAPKDGAAAGGGAAPPAAKAPWQGPPPGAAAAPAKAAPAPAQSPAAGADAPPAMPAATPAATSAAAAPSSASPDPAATPPPAKAGGQKVVVSKQEIQEKTGARLELVKQPDGSSRWKLTGTQEQIAAATALMKGAAKQQGAAKAAAPAPAGGAYGKAASAPAGGRPPPAGYGPRPGVGAPGAARGAGAGALGGDVQQKANAKFEEGKYLFSQGAGQYEKAVACFTLALTWDHNILPAQAMRGACFLALNRLGEAMQDCDAVLAKDPGNVPAKRTRGEVLLKQGEVEKALAQFDQILQVSSDGPSLYLRATAHLKRGGKADAIRDLKAAEAAGFSGATKLLRDLEGGA